MYRLAMNQMTNREIQENSGLSGHVPGRILIVDDDLDVLTALQDLLSLESDYHIEAVQDAESARNILNSFVPDIALLDVNLGTSNGIELISILKQVSADIDCIMMTAHRDVEYAVNALRHGAIDYLFKPITPQKLFQTLANLFDQRRIRHEKYCREQKLLKMAMHDSLTGLANREMLYEYLEKTLARAKRNNQQFTVMFIDLDNFKTINDLHGHKVGDELLVQFSRCLQASTRKENIISRFGGDEFVIVVSSESWRDGCETAVKRLMNAITDMMTDIGYADVISASIGLAIFPKDGMDSDTLLQNADTAMYVAKTSGKNSFHYFSGGD